jgi:hypothetical protein
MRHKQHNAPDTAKVQRGKTWLLRPVIDIGNPADAEFHLWQDRRGVEWVVLWVQVQLS